MFSREHWAPEGCVSRRGGRGETSVVLVHSQPTAGQVPAPQHRGGGRGPSDDSHKYYWDTTAGGLANPGGRLSVWGRTVVRHVMGVARHVMGVARHVMGVARHIRP